jgi:D-inositol-3-phosphate glycosyltransferase
MNGLAEQSLISRLEVQKEAIADSPSAMNMALLTGCQDRHYAYGLAMALVSRGAYVDLIGSDEIDSPELHTTSNLRFFNFRSSQGVNANFTKKLSRLLVYYWKLIRYAALSRAQILHILWNNKIELFDRTILMLYYKFLGKKVVLTAHNVNQARRDLNDSWLNRTTLKIQYMLCDHIFVHTQRMKDELCQGFDVAEKAITVIRYPLNNAFPETELTPEEAKHHLGLSEDQRVILFFGRIMPYKGIEYLLQAFHLLVMGNHANYRLIIAGEPKKGAEEYLRELQTFVKTHFDKEQVIFRLQFIPDDEMELYLKGADVLVLPYKEIFQSGILFLAYSAGLPVVASDVGSFREDIVEGRTGFLCKPGDPTDLAKALEAYFASDLYKNLNVRRGQLKDYANANHSWSAVAELSCSAYEKISGRTAL